MLDPTIGTGTDAGMDPFEVQNRQSQCTGESENVESRINFIVEHNTRMDDL